MSRRALLVVALALVAALVATGCGRTARDAAGDPATLPDTTPVASAIGASVADTAAVPGSSDETSTTAAPQAAVTDDADPGTTARLADIVSASIEQQGGTLTVQVELARALDAAALDADEQIVVGAYLLTGPDDLEPFAARLIIDAGAAPRFLFGPWLAQGQPIEGELHGTELTLTVPHLEQGRFRYAQFFAEDPGGGETLPDDAAGLVAINAR